MKRIVPCLLLVLLLLSAVGAKTQKQRQANPCENAPSQYEADECAHKEYVAADAELNKVYNQLAAKLEAEEQRAQMTAAEFSCMKYDDNDGDEEEPYYNGSTQRLMNASFLEPMAK